MKTPHLIGILGGLLAAAVVAGGACTYETYNIPLSSSGSGGGASSASKATGSNASASSTGSMTTSSSSGMGSAASSSGSSMCSTDADVDTYIAVACGGKDCDDGDTQAHPGQAMFFPMATKGTKNFDYNCDGKEEAEFVDVLTCTSALDCDQMTQKWMNGPLPACGVSAAYGICETVGLGCGKKLLGTRQQACR